MLRKCFILLLIMAVASLLFTACGRRKKPTLETQSPTPILKTQPPASTPEAQPPTPTQVTEPVTVTPAEQIVVGSKQFTEQLILGQILVQVLEDAGYRVVDRTGIGGTQVVREALESGEIDVYWEYTGTGLALVHNIPSEELPREPERAYEIVSSLDEPEGLAWLRPAEFNDTYTLMVRESMAEQGIKTMEDLAAFMNTNDASLKVCAAPEFIGRPDGLPGLQEHYGFAFRPENIVQTEVDLIYGALRDGVCEVAEGYSTDGRIEAWGFTNLEDTLQFFPVYNPAPVLREEVLDQYPDLRERLGELGAHLDDATMTQLNARVDIGLDGVKGSGDEESVETVTNLFLCDAGLLSGCQAKIEEQEACREIVGNGGLETDDDWDLPPTAWAGRYTTERVHSGERALHLGIINEDDRASHSVAHQPVVIPGNAEAAVLSYWHYPISRDLIGGDLQGVLIFDPDMSFIRKRLMIDISDDQTWSLQEHDLSGFIGAEVQLYFYVDNDGDGQPSAMYVDDVSLQVCYPSD